MKYFYALFMIFFPTINAFSQLGFKGRVTDAVTGEPIFGVHVFISQSQIGSYTNEQGDYYLTDLKRGTFSLVFSHVGYSSQVFEITNLSSIQTLDVQLDEDVKNLIDVRVDGVEDKKWGRYLKRFKQAFLGINHDQSLIRIENDYAVDFTYLVGRDFSVKNQPNFKIVNDYLGYELEFQLLSFRASKGRAFFGYSNFVEITPENGQEDKDWKNNRSKAYSGSIRHFLKSVIENAIGENGFGATFVSRKKGDLSKVELGLLNESGDPLRVAKVGDISPNVSIESIDGEYFTIEFERPLEVIFFDDLDGFGNPLKSEVVFTEPLQVFPNGVVKNPKAMVLFGYWAERGIYELLPFEYKPSN